MVELRGTAGSYEGVPADRQALGIRDASSLEIARAVQASRASLSADVQAAIDSGSIVVGGGEEDDGVAPATPVGLALDSQTAYQSSEGFTLVRALLSWLEPLDGDASAVEDGATYYVRFAEAGTGEWQTTVVEWGVEVVALYGLLPDVSYDVQVQAADKAGNRSAWSASVTFLAVHDTIAPSQPTAPSVAGGPLRIQVTHPLTKVGGGVLEQDLDHLEVHVGDTAGFTASSATLVGKLQANGAMVTAGIDALGSFPASDATPRHVRVFAVDRAGNQSVVSASSPVTAELISATYIEDATITTAKIADAQITSAKIASATITDAHIASLNADKITAGTISGNLINGGIITGTLLRTAATGARLEIAEVTISGYILDSIVWTDAAGVDAAFLGYLPFNGYLYLGDPATGFSISGLVIGSSGVLNVQGDGKVKFQSFDNNAEVWADPVTGTAKVYGGVIELRAATITDSAGREVHRGTITTSSSSGHTHTVTM